MVTEKQLQNLRPFSSTRQPIRKGRHKGPVLTDILRKLLNKRLKYEDPETQKMVESRIKDLVPLKLIMNAIQGDNEAIKEIFNRVDGKLSDKSDLESKGDTYIFANLTNTISGRPVGEVLAELNARLALQFRK